MPLVGSLEGARIGQEDEQTALLNSLRYASGIQAYNQNEQMNPLLVQQERYKVAGAGLDLKQRQLYLDNLAANPPKPGEDPYDRMDTVGQMLVNSGNWKDGGQLLIRAANGRKAAANTTLAELRQQTEQDKHEKNFLEHLSKVGGGLDINAPIEQKQAAWDGIRQLVAEHGGVSVEDLNPDKFPAQYSDGAYQAIMNETLDEAKRRDLRIKEADEKSKEANRKSQEENRNNMIWYRKERIRQENEKETRLAKTVGSKALTGPRQTDIDQAAAMIMQQYPEFKQDGKVDPGVMVAAGQVAARAKALQQANPALDWSTAMGQALKEASDAGEIARTVVPKTILGIKYGEDKGVKYEQKGVTPDKAIEMKPGQSDATVGKYYSDGRYSRKYLGVKNGVPQWGPAIPTKSATMRAAPAVGTSKDEDETDDNADYEEMQ